MRRIRSPISLNAIHRLLPEQLFLRLHALRYWLFTEPEARHCKRFVRPGGVVVDVGACWGAYTYLFSRVASRVIAIEPNPELAAYLGRVAPPGVEVYPVAASATRGSARLRIPPRGPDPYALATLHGTGRDQDDWREVEVPTVTLDELSVGPVDLMKIDAEGYEEEILAGATKTLEEQHPDLLIELEEHREPGLLERVTRQLSDLGYTGYFLFAGRWHHLDEFDPHVHQNPRTTSIHSRRFVNLFHFTADQSVDGDRRWRPRVGQPLELVRLFLAEQREPAAFYERLARDAVEAIPADLHGSRVVDLGCGPGHYTRALREAGAFVVPMDLDPREFSLPGGPPGGHLLGNGMHLPLATASVDGLLCSNMIEHTPDPHRVIDEMHRVVRPGGWIWLSWTNWYSPWGGHDVSPWHYLGPTRALAIYRRLHNGRDPKNCPGRTLFPLHIGPTLRRLRETPGLRLVGAVPRYYPSQRWILAVPGFREVATWNCLVLLERTSS